MQPQAVAASLRIIVLGTPVPAVNPIPTRVSHPLPFIVALTPYDQEFLHSLSKYSKYVYKVGHGSITDNGVNIHIICSSSRLTTLVLFWKKKKNKPLVIIVQIIQIVYKDILSDKL